MMNKVVLSFFIIICLNESCSRFGCDIPLKYCDKKVDQSINALQSVNGFPRSVTPPAKTLRCVTKEDWTSGFWPGILWYDYEYTHRPEIKALADSFTMALSSLAFQKAYDHDLGFIMTCSFGNAYRLTGLEKYKRILLAAADTLATLYNPNVGTILSWPRMVGQMNWPHNTIIDNMMNLELLFWASKNGNNSRLYDIAVKHAETTMKNHFRKDYSAYHVLVYDTVTGRKIKGCNHQGYSDSSMWARGQAWAIYGFTMSYRETKKPEFLDFARKVADIYLKRLPDDYIPYWDFDDPAIPNAPKDASAAAITASALLELSTFVKDKENSSRYFESAKKILEVLSSGKYFTENSNPFFLAHSTGNMPIKGEVDASIVYADYYFLEALLRMKRMGEKNP